MTEADRSYQRKEHTEVTEVKVRSVLGRRSLSKESPACPGVNRRKSVRPNVYIGLVR